MKKALPQKRFPVFAVLWLLAAPGFAQEVFLLPPSPTEQSAPASNSPLLLPMNASSIWRMGDSLFSGSRRDIDFDEYALAENPGGAAAAKPRPAPEGVYFGAPPKSPSSLTVGGADSDIDYFLSTTGFQSSSFLKNFGYFALDYGSLSAGVSRRFGKEASGGEPLISLYYNGNIIDDLSGFGGATYNWPGQIENQNNIDSRGNIDLFFGMGPVGIDVGYSQKLYGKVEKHTGYTYTDAVDAVDAVGDPEDEDYQPAQPAIPASVTIKDTEDAILDNALVPHIELGFRLVDSGRLAVNMSLGFQADIHQYREQRYGKDIAVGGEAAGVPAEVTSKLAGDYLEPAASLRFEFNFPSDNQSQLGLGLEAGFRMKSYSNSDDKSGTVAGVYWSKRYSDNDSDSVTYGKQMITYSVTEGQDIEFRLRPSVRYVTRITDQVKVGLSGGFGAAMGIGSTTTTNYKSVPYEQYSLYSENNAANEEAFAPYAKGQVESTVTSTPDLDLALYPGLGVGIALDVVPKVFSVNAGISAAQTLYSIKTGSTETAATQEVTDLESGETTQETVTTTVPFQEQDWGKPYANITLGAAFTFRQNFGLYAVFSSNGTSLEDTNFVVSLSAKY